MHIAEHQLNVHYSALNVTLLSCSPYQILGSGLVVLHQFALIVDKSQIMQRFNVFCLCCLFEVFQTLGLVSVLFVAEVKGSQIVQSSWEVLVCCLFVVIMCFLKVGLKDGPVCFLIDQSILVEVAHVGQSLQVTVTACLLPHLQVFKCFSIEATLVKRSQPVQCFIIFLPVCLFVVFDGFLKVFVDNRALFVQYSCNPFGVRQLFNKFLCNISVRTE